MVLTLKLEARAAQGVPFGVVVGAKLGFAKPTKLEFTGPAGHMVASFVLEDVYPAPWTVNDIVLFLVLHELLVFVLIYQKITFLQLSLGCIKCMHFVQILILHKLQEPILFPRSSRMEGHLSVMHVFFPHFKAKSRFLNLKYFL